MDVPQRAIFLNELAQGWSPTFAANAAKVPRGTVYNLRDADPTFRQQWDAALEAGSDLMEDEVRRRGLLGWDEPVVYQGKLTGAVVRKFDSTLAMFMLNGRRPEKYRQNVRVDAPDLAAVFRGAMQKATSLAVSPPKANGHDRAAETAPV